MGWKDLRIFRIVSPRHLDQEWGHDSSGGHLLSDSVGSVLFSQAINDFPACQPGDEGLHMMAPQGMIEKG
jgi:hypothetical protein